MTITTDTGFSTDIVAGTWTIDPSHSEVGLHRPPPDEQGARPVHEVRGHDRRRAPRSRTPAPRPRIDLNSVDTRDEQRDAHLRSADFFDVENTGPMTFAATDFDGSTAHRRADHQGRHQPVELDVEFLGAGPDPWGNQRLGFEATTVINRKDFGVDFNIPLDGGKVLVGDKVNIHARRRGRPRPGLTHQPPIPLRRRG